MAALDNPGGTPSQWLLITCCLRYIAAGIVIVSGAACLFIPTVDMEVKALGFEAANIAFGFYLVLVLQRILEVKTFARV